MTYEEYRDIVYKACKEDATAKAYPEEFESCSKNLKRKAI